MKLGATLLCVVFELYHQLPMFVVLVLEIADGWGLPRESMSFTDFDIKEEAPEKVTFAPYF